MAGCIWVDLEAMKGGGSGSGRKGARGEDGAGAMFGEGVSEVADGVYFGSLLGRFHGTSCNVWVLRIGYRSCHFTQKMRYSCLFWLCLNCLIV